MFARSYSHNEEAKQAKRRQAVQGNRQEDQENQRCALCYPRWCQAMNPPKAKIYLIRDERANRFGTPLFSQLPAEAIADSYRTSIINNLEKSVPLQDCVLYEVGEFDTVTGEITQLDKNSFIMVARLGDFVQEALNMKKLEVAHV